MKKIEKLGKSVLALSVLANTFMPLSLVNAEGETPTTYSISISTSNPDWQLVEETDGIQVMTKGETPTNVAVIKVKDKDDNLIAPHGCHDGTCIYNIDADKTVNISYPGDKLDITPATGPACVIDPGYDINGNQTLDIKAPATEDIPQCGTSGGNTGGGEHHEDFDGKAVLVWTCGTSDAKVCYHQFTELKSDEVNYIKGSTIQADNISGEKFNINAKYKFFSPQDLFDSKKADIDNQDAKPIDTETLKGKDGLDYMPVGEPIENNALVAYGNRQFKAIVYGSDFKGVSIGNLDELHYYPQEWNDWFLRREVYDMSGTTKEHPVEIDTVLLESKLILRLRTDLNDYTITKVEALDIPEAAVKITDREDGTYEFDFKSNFYDKVVFKVTTSDNKEQFIYINRRTIDPFIKTDGKTAIVAEVFYDRLTSYDDYNVLAKIVNKDGSSKVVKLNPAKGYKDGLGNEIKDYEVDEESTTVYKDIPTGRGMKRAYFDYEISKDELKKVDKIYINVERDGSTSEFYAGNFAGSGKGDVLDMKYWEDRLN